MRKKTNTIEINGKRYDANTGELLSHQGAVPVSHAKPTPKPSSIKTPVKPTPHHPAQRARGRHVSRAPRPARTLMRQAVRKPRPSLKRRIKVTGHTDSFAPQPALAIVSPTLVRRPDKQRLQHAHRIAKSRLISRFSAGTTIVSNRILSTPAAPQTTAPAKSVATLPPKPSKAALLFEQGLQRATSHLEPAPKVPRRRFHRKHKVHAHSAR